MAHSRVTEQQVTCEPDTAISGVKKFENRSQAEARSVRDLFGWLRGRSAFEGRFWSGVAKSSECWMWLRGLNRDGYGQFSVTVDGVRFGLLTHRVAWGLDLGEELPRSVVLMHTCDVRACCNPAHLRPGTASENHADMVAKGRIAKGDKCRLHPESRRRGDRHPYRLRPETILCGSRVGTSKITRDDVIAIRARHARGETPSSIASSYPVTPEAIGMIVHRKNWKHIPDGEVS